MSRAQCHDAPPDIQILFLVDPDSWKNFFCSLNMKRIIFIIWVSSHHTQQYLHLCGKKQSQVMNFLILVLKCDSQWSTHPFRGGVHTSSSVNARFQSLTGILNDLHCNAYEFRMVSMLKSICNRLNQIDIIRWHLIATHHHNVYTTSPPTSSKHDTMIR
jgi:hypothetical protein